MTYQLLTNTLQAMKIYVPVPTLKKVVVTNESNDMVAAIAVVLISMGLNIVLTSVIVLFICCFVLLFGTVSLYQERLQVSWNSMIS